MIFSVSWTAQRTLFSALTTVIHLSRGLQTKSIFIINLPLFSEGFLPYEYTKK